MSKSDGDYVVSTICVLVAVIFATLALLWKELDIENTPVCAHACRELALDTIISDPPRCVCGGSGQVRQVFVSND